MIIYLIIRIMTSSFSTYYFICKYTQSVSSTCVHPSLVVGFVLPNVYFICIVFCRSIFNLLSIYGWPWYCRTVPDYPSGIFEILLTIYIYIYIYRKWVNFIFIFQKRHCMLFSEMCNSTVLFVLKLLNLPYMVPTK